MKKTIILTAIACITSLAIYAQGPINGQGKIQYEKKVNELAYVKQVYSSTEDQANVDQYAKNNPQFQSYSFELVFDNKNSIYSPLNSTPRKRAVSEVGRNNIVYTNLEEGTYVTQKTIFNNLFLIKGPLKKIKWKITSETRKIAEYECRRANGLMADSTYVVAFYTEEIPFKGGPELFNGLPGMILGIALPADHITWFAKTITLDQPKEIPIVAPKGGKQESMDNLLSHLESDLSTYGPIRPFLLKNVSY